MITGTSGNTPERNGRQQPMNRRVSVRKWFSILLISQLICCMLSGCGESGYEVMRGVPETTTAEAPAVAVIPQPAAVSLPLPVISEVKLDYEVPVQIPNILVDQWGYGADSEKTIRIRGLDDTEPFEIRDSSTDEVVYSGITGKHSHEQNGEELRYAAFSELTTPGSYYVYNDTVGYSYLFEIKEDSYGELMRETIRRFYLNRCGMTLTEALAGEDAHSACHTLPATLQSDSSVSLDVSGGWHLDALADRDVCLSCSIVTDLLLSYNLYPDAFTDDLQIPESGDGIPDILNEVAYEAEWLLKMQDPRTGGVYGSAVTAGVDENSNDQDLLSARIEVTPVTLSATIAMAKALAMFSYDYQAYDAAFSTKCLRAADRAYQFFIKNSDGSEAAAASRFAAAACFYRATGRLSYQYVLAEMFQQENFYSNFTGNDDLLSGCLMYLITRQRQDTEVCSALMKTLLRDAETIAADAQDNPWTVINDDDPMNFPKDLKVLVFVDRIITNAEYTGIIAGHVHYLCGCNPDAINLVTDDTDRTYLDMSDPEGLLSDPLRVSQFILLLSALKSYG